MHVGWSGNEVCEIGSQESSFSEKKVGESFEEKHIAPTIMLLHLIKMVLHSLNIYSFRNANVAISCRVHLKHHFKFMGRILGQQFDY